MSQAIINIAMPVVDEKIDSILNSYPLYPHQQAFALPDLRHKLSAYVLSRMPALYATWDSESSTCSPEAPASCYSREEHRTINRLIHEGIEHLLTSRYEEHPISLTESSFSPSSWFG